MSLFKYLKIVTAIFILSISINMFLGPHHIAAGGVSGIGILAEYLFGINRAWIVLTLNIVMILLAYLFLERNIFFQIIFGSILFPLTLRIVPEIMFTSDRLLSVIFGSIIFAVGVAILYNNRASSGGTTIPPLIFEKYFHLSTSIGLLFTDALIVTMSLFVFGVEEFLLAILSLGITSIVMSYIETGLKRKKAIIIISKHHSSEIQAKLDTSLNRGMTFIPANGRDHQTPRDMIYLVIKNQEYPLVKQIIDAVDPHCFFVTYTVAEVHGHGFTYHPIQ
jgi:uncharacterized membrane-anchored protein YitT (DUF2179 family)